MQLSILSVLVAFMFAQTSLAQTYIIQFDSFTISGVVEANNVPGTLAIDASPAGPLGATISCAIQTPGPGGWLLIGRFGPFVQCNSGAVYGTAGLDEWEGLDPHTPLFGCYDVDINGTVTVRLTTNELGCASPLFGLAGDFNGDGRCTAGDLFAAIAAYCRGSLSMTGLFDFLDVYLL